MNFVSAKKHEPNCEYKPFSDPPENVNNTYFILQKQPFNSSVMSLNSYFVCTQQSMYTNLVVDKVKYYWTDLLLLIRLSNENCSHSQFCMGQSGTANVTEIVLPRLPLADFCHIRGLHYNLNAVHYEAKPAILLILLRLIHSTSPTRDYVRGFF